MQIVISVQVDESLVQKLATALGREMEAALSLDSVKSALEAYVRKEAESICLEPDVHCKSILNSDCGDRLSGQFFNFDEYDAHYQRLLDEADARLACISF